ncbi:MAG: iron ABC transporter permease [Bacteroidetes bacterium]|nr:MAG: iron ABC transporter permease [Bacteroidota bacterium]
MPSRSILIIYALGLLLIVLFLLDIRLGSLSITFADMLSHLMGRTELSEQQVLILTKFRLPRIATALMAGAALPVCGLQMQTLFRNPLAGPYVLGISSGASFGAAIVVLGAGATGLVATWSLAIAAWIGAGTVMLLLLFVSYRIKDVMTILILGIMFSSGLAAIISIMQYFSQAAALKSFVIWSMGSLGNVTGAQLTIMAWAILPLLMVTLAYSKVLNGLMLGEEYALSMGVRIQRTRLVIFATTSIMAGTITAFCGPIGFIGIAVPHMARFLLNRSDHRVLMPASMLTGMVVMVFSDIVSRLPGTEQILPINAVTSLIGIPVVIWLVVMNRKAQSL